MKALVFDVGGTSIKYGRCENGVLTNLNETPTEAELGGAHILQRLISLIKKEQDFDAIGISTAGQVNAKTGSIIYANSNIPNYTGMELKKCQQQYPKLYGNGIKKGAVGAVSCACHGGK